MLYVERELVADYTLHVYPDISQSVFYLLNYLSFYYKQLSFIVIYKQFSYKTQAIIKYLNDRKIEVNLIRLSQKYEQTMISLENSYNIYKI